MLPNIENYNFREQSYIKHIFLVKYLENAAFKLFQGRSPVFNYVDAFSGPWRNADPQSMSDTSFGLAIRTLENVRSTLAKGRPDLRIRFRFCEKNPEAYEKLKEFSSKKSEFDIKVFLGTFEDNLPAIRATLSDISDSFTFTFIDPTGWNIDSKPVFNFLKEIRGEVLFNFMAEHVNRHAGWDRVAESLGRFLADPHWRPSFEGMKIGSNEEKILHLLKLNMRQAGVAQYFPDMAIRKPREDRIKMRLILGTSSSHGVEVFRTVQEKVEKEAVRTHLAIRTGVSGQPSLFSNEQIADFATQREGVGCPSNLEAAKNAFVEAVLASPGAEFGKLACELMERIPVRTTHLNAIAMNLRQSARVHFDLPGNKRTPLPETTMYPPR